MQNTLKRGAIVVNQYGRQNLSIAQATRIKEEFSVLGLNVPIIKTEELGYIIDKDKITSKYSGLDFAVYLDKDKYFSEVLTSLGIKLFNSHNAIRLCDDKGRTYIALANAGIKVPKTILAPLCYMENQEISLETAQEIGKELSYPVIVKESYGSLGQGVYMAKTDGELLTLINALKLKPHLYQEYIGAKKGEDIRVIMVGGKVIASMKRTNPNDFRSNVYQGGNTKKFDLPKTYINTCEKVSKLLGLDYCGIDLLEDGTTEPVVCEVNSNAFFEGIEKATGVNVAKTYVEYIIKNI